MQTTIGRVYASLFLASKWILKTFDSPAIYEDKRKSEITCLLTNTNFDDLDGLSNKIIALYTIAESGVMIDDSRYSEIKKSHSSDGDDRIGELWIDSYMRNIKEKYNEYLSIYLKMLLSKKKPLHPRDYKYNLPIFSSCIGCPNIYKCLDPLKTILSSVFTKDFVNKGRILKEIFNCHKEDIRTILRNQALRPMHGKIAGFPHTIGDGKFLKIEQCPKCGHEFPHTIDDGKFSAYNSISVLKFLNEFKEEIIKSEKVSFDEIYTNIISQTMDSQVKINEIVTRDEIGDKIDIRGSWAEGYWDKFNVYRIKSTSNIAIILFHLSRVSKSIDASKSIDMAKIFIDNAFKDQKSFVVDLVDYRDIFESDISDISGTISALQFYLTVAEIEKYKINVNSDDFRAKIEWLVKQQISDGSFPVLSRSLLDKQGNGHVECTPSLANTLDAIKLLHSYLKRQGAS